MRIREITEDNRPRERLAAHGPSVLSDAELLAVILGSGNKNENVVEMCNRLLSRFTLEKLNKCSLNELQALRGIGVAKACQIQALFEIAKRHSFNGKANNYAVRNAKDVYEYCKPFMHGLDKEIFMILHLDTKNKIIRKETVSIGTLNSSLIHPREVFKSAIKESANAIILVHNHPSGDSTPSDEDREVTKILVKAGELLSIKVLDHVIIGYDNYWSWKNEK